MFSCSYAAHCQLVLSFWSLSNRGEPHPAACHGGSLSFIPPGNVRFFNQYRLVPLVAGDLVGLLFCNQDDDDGDFTVWRWTTGQKLMVRCHFRCARGACLSLRFLSTSRHPDSPSSFLSYPGAFWPSRACLGPVLLVQLSPPRS